MNSVANSLTNERRADTAIFAASLGAAKQGCLEITSGISNFDLTGDPATGELFRGQFVGQIPDVGTRNEMVIIHYGHSVTDWIKHLFPANRHTAQVILNTSIPWHIEIRGGVAHLDADLRQFQLRAMIVTDGIAETRVLLPRPLGIVPIHMTGGVSQSMLLRPEGVSARLKTERGVSQLAFDDQSYGSLGGGIRLETPGYKEESDRYDIRVRGGVSKLIIRTQA